MVPTFSVIIPVYNAQQHIKRCMESIIDQSYTDLEIILINDGSTDNSGEICDDYAQKDKRVKVIHKENGGVSSARNAGLEIATGDYISFIDPDDWIDRNMYETLFSHISDANIDVLRFNAYRKDEIINELPFDGVYTNEDLENKVLLPMIGAEAFGGMFILGVLWLHIYKREIIEKYHIRFNTRLRRCEDRLFTLTFTIHAKSMKFIKDVLYHYEVYDESLSNKYDPYRWEQELIYLNELKEEYYKYKPKTFITEANRRIQSEYVLRSITSINNEFFSRNNSSFFSKYKNTKTIVNNPIVKTAIKNTQKNPMGLKGWLTINMIKHRHPFMLSIFNSAILLKNKIA